MTDNTDRIWASRAIKAWKLYKRGELPASVEVVAVQGVTDARLGEVRRAVEGIADADGGPLIRLASSTVKAASDDDAEMRRLTRDFALEHGMSEEELPIALRNLDR
ncbi:hypothetical protein QA600_18590 [Natronococcus sp. A-GB1]|uniref:hypothetical protein n=1 Tax=Natronococcus sp. A-GB1 TaxID=3037648 RepID=UPI00241D0B80|nr:hypothetical protein [Natronococcus sp. A-GB1]MDG5761342.1 hypothetical protein [Natronococcus sp. A-GB1]